MSFGVWCSWEDHAPQSWTPYYHGLFLFPSENLTFFFSLSCRNCSLKNPDSASATWRGITILQPLHQRHPQCCGNHLLECLPCVFCYTLILTVCIPKRKCTLRSKGWKKKNPWTTPLLYYSTCRKCNWKNHFKVFSPYLDGKWNVTRL